MADFIKKVVMLGDPMVGKTSLVQRYVKNMFDDTYLTTIGTKPSKKEVKVGQSNVIIMIWDIAGHSYTLHPEYYVGAKGALLVCDLTRRSTLENLMSWYTSLANRVGDVPIVILANKADVLKSEFNLEDVERLGFRAMRTSAKTGENVELAFMTLAEDMTDER